MLALIFFLCFFVYAKKPPHIHFGQSKKERQRILPIIVGITGCVFRASASGNVIDMVKTDPRLVPTQSVGNELDGSIEIEQKRCKRIESLSHFPRFMEQRQ